MPPKIVFEITEGPLAGQQHTFDERTTCILGRMPDCNLRLPSDQDHRTVSRHHCILDINPPDIRIRDFGSRNGTFVNGELIGKRDKDMTPEEGQRMEFPEVDLKEGDQVRLGASTTTFRVRVQVPVYCAECSVEIPEGERAQAERAPGVFQCSICRARAEQQGRRKPPHRQQRICAHCGKNVEGEVGDARQGEYLCAECRVSPSVIIADLLRQAESGEQELRDIDGYTILRELGRGGMGAVYLAQRQSTGDQVALKIMLPQVACDEKARAMFLRETTNTRALRHRNVVQLHDAGCSQGTFFLTLEFCNGGSVDKLMEQRGGVLSIDEGIQIITQVLDGLEYAHHAEIPHVRLANGQYGQGHGLVHRDLKPQNIFLENMSRTSAGGKLVAKVGDYGLAKAFDTAGLSGLTRSGSVMGTPVFMPRQQVRNFKYAKPEVDIWAAAASLYAMLTGSVPRDFPRRTDPWQIVLSTEPVPIQQRNSSVPRRLAQVIDQALQDSGELHFKSAADLKRALQDAV